jgi:AcrR family transcriptional regulator
MSGSTRTPRLNRSEQQAQTRADILETAQRLFLKHGYAGTSLDEIAEQAGYSKGAVYSNFRDKSDLCLAVMDAVRDRHAELVTKAITEAGSLEERLAALENWAQTAVGNPEWSALQTEFAATARGNADLPAELARRDREDAASVAALIAAAADSPDIALALPPAELAIAINSLVAGLGLRRAHDPKIPVQVLTDVLRILTTAGSPGSAS